MGRPTTSLRSLISEGLRHGGDLVGQELELMRRETDGNIRAILGLIARFGTAIVLVVAMGLTFSAGAGGEGGMRIWPLFGTANQLLASLTLSIVAVILLRKKRNPLPALVPLVFVFVMSFYAAIVQLGTLREDEDWLLLGIDVVIIVAAVCVAVEAVLAMRAARSMPEETDAHDREAAAPESATR